MMELFADFDETLFEQGKEKVDHVPFSYNAKICQRNWFLDESLKPPEEEVVELRHYYKQRAEYLQQIGDFQQALTTFQICLELDCGRIERRCVHEAIAYCMLKLGKYEQALTAARVVLDGAINEDQKLTSLYLMNKIYHAKADIPNSLLTTQQLLAFHHCNVELWIILASAYQKYHRTIDTKCSSMPGSESGSNKIHGTLVLNDETLSVQKHLGEMKISTNCSNQEHDDCDLQQKSTDLYHSGKFDCRLKAITCLLVARSSILAVQKSVRSFVRERNLLLLKKVEEMIDELNFVIPPSPSNTDSLLAQLKNLDITADGFQKQFEMILCKQALRV
ncbi:uncharacterized protein C8orf76 homolog [Tubulanus polymorphus]|uniref:uncharacterized protein C8orf76 homolog n=1 Tax=Tubulanus polymorphus TaxID=672921 RepID=UPI003DA4ABCA